MAIKKKKEKITFWDRSNILKIPAHYYVVYGERSNGKTYGALEECLIEYFEGGKEFAYIRRWDDDIKGARGGSIFNGLVANNVIKKLSKNKYDSVVYKGRCYYLKGTDKNTGEEYQSDSPFAYAFALSMHEHYKSNSYPRIGNIVFDEFITRGAYLDDEFVIFENVISTLVRLRDDVKIFMLGNSVNKYNPYIREMGLNKMRTQEKGTIDVYTYGDSGLRVAVEYSDMPVKQKKSNVYFAFKNNPRLEMIKNGAWEIDLYPHYPREYGKPLPKELLYKFYIEFEGSILQCDIIKKDEVVVIDDEVANKSHTLPETIFIFIHPKTTPIALNETALVYSQDTNPKPNYRRKLTKPVSRLEKRIALLFLKDKVFYSDNETGEIVRNYLLWCK